MKPFTTKILIISGILPASFLAYFCVLGLVLVMPSLFEEWDWFSFFLSGSCLLGLGGYFGLWFCLLHFSLTNRYKMLLLTGGIISILFILYHHQELSLQLSLKTKDFGRVFLFIWPLVVSVVLLVQLVLKRRRMVISN